MTNQKGFDNWIPIFRGGKQIASNGKEYDGDALIEKALANFNAAKHEPPAVIGHPKDDTAPSYGWVEGLKKRGNLLLAKFKQVQPDFAGMVQNGLFKKRSAAFYPDGTLRHVGFLGATPPAVKGLPDVAFAEGEDARFDFSEPWAWNSVADVFRSLRELIIAKFGQDTADQIIPDYKIEELRSAANAQGDDSADEQQINQYNEKKEEKNMSFKEKVAALFAEILAKIGGDTPIVPQTVNPVVDALKGTKAGIQEFSEADLAKIRSDAEAKGKQMAQTEFAEQTRQSRLATIKGEIAAFCEKLIAAGKITPATVSFGLPEILFSMAEIDNQIEFGEKKEKFTAFDRLKELLESATPLVTFTEVATRAKDTGDNTDGAKRDKLVTAFMESKKVDYKEAVLAVSKEHPDLFK